MKTPTIGKNKHVPRNVGDTLMSNTVYVNKHYPFNDLQKRVFVSIEAAYYWIVRYGNPTTKNKWRILCAPGEDVSIVTNPNVYVWDGSAMQMNIPLSNNVWVNQDALFSNPDLRIFNDFDEAYAWILANGNLSATNQWRINLPAGTIPSVTMYQDVMVSVPDGGIIDELHFDMTFTGIDNVFRSYLAGATINKMIGSPLKIVYLYDCIIKDVEAIEDTFDEEDEDEENPLQFTMIMNSCKILKGDFQNYTIVDASYSLFQSYLGDINNLSYSGTDIICINTETYQVNLIDTVEHNGGRFSPTSFENITVVNASITNINVSANEASFMNCTFENFIISGGIVSTYGCSIRGTLTKTGGTWINNGTLYNPAESLIPAVETQGAIDAIAAQTMNKLSEQIATAVYAWSRLTAVGEDNVLNNETITLNLGELDEEVFTFKTTLTEPAEPNEILIGADIVESLENAAAVIDDNSLIVDAAFTSPATFISNKNAGSIGNGITVATSSAAISVLHAALQGGGYEYTINIRDGKYRDITVYDDTFIYLNPQSEDRNMEIELTLRQDEIDGNHAITIQSTEGNIYSPSGAGYTPTLTAGAIDIVKLRWSGTEWFMTVDLDMGMPS